IQTLAGEREDDRVGGRGRYCKMYTERGLAKPRRKKWLARKMNKIMKKKGKFRVEMQKRTAPTGRISQTPFVSAMTIGKRVVTLRLRRECCWIYSNIMVVERSYEAVGKTVTRGYASCYAWVESCRIAAASQVIDPLSVRSREFGLPASQSTRRSIDPANPATRSTCTFARTKLTSYDHLPVHKSPKTHIARPPPPGPFASCVPTHLMRQCIANVHCIAQYCNTIPIAHDIINPNKYKHERVKDMTAAAMKMAGRPTLVEYKAAGGLGSESRGQSEPVGRARRQPQPQTERLRAASAPEHRPH
ncbi:hypothetical protein ALC53_11675, partial [Atta colombica]